MIVLFPGLFFNYMAETLATVSVMLATFFGDHFKMLVTFSRVRGNFNKTNRFSTSQISLYQSLVTTVTLIQHLSPTSVTNVCHQNRQIANCLNIKINYDSKEILDLSAKIYKCNFKFPDSGILMHSGTLRIGVYLQ